jgi:hypothetical protein
MYVHLGYGIFRNNLQDEAFFFFNPEEVGAIF